MIMHCIGCQKSTSGNNQEHGEAKWRPDSVLPTYTITTSSLLSRHKKTEVLLREVLPALGVVACREALSFYDSQLE
jgi:hypothetical protein